MTDLWGTGLIEGLPPAVADEPWVRIMDKVYRERHRREMEAAERIHLYTQIDSQPEEVLDVLAVQFKVDWYRDDYPIETKRRVIKTAMEVRRYCGTEWAVKQAISAIYPNSEIIEWYDYGGTPGHWRVNVDVTDEDAAYHATQDIEKRLGYARRCTAHLERITYVAKPKEKVRAYVAPSPSSLYCTMSARVRGKIPPQSGRAAAFAGAAAAGVYAQTGAKLRLED